MGGLYNGYNKVDIKGSVHYLHAGGGKMGDMGGSNFPVAWKVGEGKELFLAKRGGGVG